MTSGEVIRFLLVLCRLGGVFSVGPVLGSASIPVTFRVTAVLALTVLSAPLAPMPPPLTDDLGMALAIFGEMSVGFLFGLVITYIMTGAQTAGGIIGGQIGFGLGGLFDPEFSESTDALPQLFQLFSLAIFLALDGPGRLLEAVRVSFDRFPPGTVEPSLRAVGMLIAAFSGIFLAALKLVGPLLAGLLVMNVAMGSVARAVPSLNLFVMDIPVKVLVGVGGLIILLPGFASVFSELLEQGWKDIARVMAFL